MQTRPKNSQGQKFRTHKQVLRIMKQKDPRTSLDFKVKSLSSSKDYEDKLASVTENDYSPVIWS